MFYFLLFILFTLTNKCTQ